jgi:hypothetical protein
LPDFTTYQPPGVYIEEDLSSLVNVIGVRPTVVALVGPAVGYRTQTEALILTGTELSALSHLGANPVSVQVKAPDGTSYTTGIDFTVTAAAGTDGDIAKTADNSASVARVADGAIPDGGIVYVTYQYTDADYHAPLRTRDFDDVQDAYGPPIDLETGRVISPLSFAAKIAFENGANQVVLVSTTGTVDATSRVELTNAYAQLATLYDVNVVVPLPVGISGNIVDSGDTTNVAADLKLHLDTMAAEGLLRVGVLGYETAAEIDPAALANSVKSGRVVLAWPNRLNYYNGYRNQTVEVAGYYLAAAYAGRMASLPVQMPLTKKQINGFSGFPSSVAKTMTVSQKNTWSEAGVAVTELTRDGRLTVRHGTTTNRTNVQTRELSLVRAKDALVNLIQETLDASELVGTYIDDDTALRVKSVIEGVLESAKGSEVIIDYTNLKIRQLAGDPSVMEVKFQYKPAYPLNYIVVSFSIDTSTGETSILDVAE